MVNCHKAMAEYTDDAIKAYKESIAKRSGIAIHLINQMEEEEIKKEVYLKLGIRI